MSNKIPAKGGRIARSRAATIADVASAAGCSTAAVSCVINGNRGNIGVGDAMRARIMEAAQKLNYRPSFASRSLALRRTHTVGVYVPPNPGAGLACPYESALLAGVETACFEAGYDILAINLGGRLTPEVCAHKLAERRIDGLLLFHVPHDVAWIEPLCASSHNVAAVNYYGTCRNLDVINFDDAAATTMAVDHLAAMGHKRIAYVDTLRPDRGPGEDLRHQGFIAAMRRLALPVDPLWLVTKDHPALQSLQTLSEVNQWDCAVQSVLAYPLERRPTAWLAHSDVVALALSKILRRHGVVVPTEASIVGIDDSDLCCHSDPELTSVRQPFARMGQWAARRVIARAADRAESIPWAQERALPEWVERGSTTPISLSFNTASNSFGLSCINETKGRGTVLQEKHDDATIVQTV